MDARRVSGMDVTPRMSLGDYRANLAAASKQTSLRTGVARRQPEYEEQVSLFVFLDLLAIAYPDRVDDLRDCWASANGGLRSRKTAGRLRAAGARRGVPDIEVMVAMNGRHGMFIELKAPGSGRASAEQKDRIARLNRRGYLAVIAFGWVEAGRALCAYLGIAWSDRLIVQVELERSTRKAGDWCKGVLHQPSVQGSSTDAEAIGNLSRSLTPPA